MDLREELKLRNISINECSKKTGIPYSALFAIVHKKVKMENCQYRTLKKLTDFFFLHHRRFIFRFFADDRILEE